MSTSEIPVLKIIKVLTAAAVLLVIATFSSPACAQSPRWPEQQANAWYAQQPWLVGSNYIPKSAINQLEMWQEPTFDPQQIDTELGWAESLGMNTMRVFLHDLLWQEDPVGFQQRIDQLLDHRLPPSHPPDLRALRLLLGPSASSWSAAPADSRRAQFRLGPESRRRQRWPTPINIPRLKEYVQGVIGAFAKDDRILAWDLWNEPGADNAGSYAKTRK